MAPAALGAWLAAVAVAVAAGIYLFQRARTLFRVVERMAHLLTSELTNNSGTSMKDNVEAAAEDVHGIAIAVGVLQRGMDEAARRIEQLEAERAERRRGDTAPGQPLARRKPGDPSRGDLQDIMEDVATDTHELKEYQIPPTHRKDT